MNRKLYLTGLALVLGAGYALIAFAQVKPEVLVKQRQAVMILQGKYFYGQLKRMAQGRRPYDAKMAAQAVGYLDALSQMPWDGFDPSTANVKSAALPAAFTDSAKFKDAQDRVQGEIAKLVSVSKSGDEAAVKAQIIAVDKACNNCHESFREKE